MEQLSLGTLIAVFEEMFGATLFWLLVVAAVLGALAFFYVLVTRGRLQSRWFLRAELMGLFGGVGLAAAVMLITSSSIADIGGPVDLLLLIGIWAVGAVGTALVAYTVQGLFSRDAGE